MKFSTRYFHTAIYPWIIWTLASGFFFYKYLVQVSPAIMTADLMQAFQVNGAGLGNLSAFYFYAYLIMQIPVGVLIDRYSPRLMTTGAIFLCSFGAFLFSNAKTLWLAAGSRALIGMGASFAAVSCFKLATQWFSPRRFALVSGMFMTSAMFGAVFGQMPLSLLKHAYGWRHALEIVSAMGAFLGILYFFVVRDKKTQVLAHHAAYTSNTHTFRSIILSSQTWFLSLFSGLAFAPVSVFGGLWGVPFLEVSAGLSQQDAAFSISFIFIGFAAGAPLLGWLSDFIERRKPILLGGMLLALCCLTSVIYAPIKEMFWLSVLLFGFGFGTSGFFTSFAMIREIFPLTLAATVLGIMNTFDSVCEALYEPLVGAFLDWTWQGVMKNGARFFSIESYHQALSLLPFSLILALLMLCFIKETYRH